MHKEDAIRFIIEYAAELPAKQALACHMAATDVQEFGIEDWIEWTPMAILDTFSEIMTESSANSIDRVQAYSKGEEFLDELILEGYVTTEGDDQERIDYILTMQNMRDSMLEGLDAMRTYFEVQQKIRQKYYGLY